MEIEGFESIECGLHLVSFVTVRISSRKSLRNASNPSQNGVTVTRSGADGRTHTCTSRKFHPYDQPGTWHHSWQAHSRESRLYLSTTCHGFEAASSKAKQSRMVSAASSGSMIGGNPFTILVAASFFVSGIVYVLLRVLCIPSFNPRQICHADNPLLARMVIDIQFSRVNVAFKSSFRPHEPVTVFET